jgi:hypothetical protein
MERLDPACLRRFALKLRFDPLTPAQAAVAFRRFFGIEALDALMAGLTPGDFATVRKKHSILGGDARALTEWLMDELESKGGRRRIGSPPASARQHLGALEAVMLYYWVISLVLMEILPELALILIPIGLLVYLLPYWHIILGIALAVFMWVHWSSLHW